MGSFLGEIACKLDDKSRLSVPAKFLKQMPSESSHAFVLNRGLDRCLVLYTLPEWASLTADMEKLNLYDEEHRRFMRLFFRGATDIELDSGNRILLPKRLLDYANIHRDVMLIGYMNRIEIWANDQYEEEMDIDPADFSRLAASVMTNKTS